MSIDIKQATLESLLATYFFRTSAESAVRKLHELIASNQRFTLDRLLRDHRLRGNGVMEGPESEGRAGTDRLLKCCSVLEIASQAGAILSQYEQEWRLQLLTVLTDSSVRRYYEDFYPEVNPQLFLLRLLGVNSPTIAYDDASSWALFNRFLELDSRFVADLEEGPRSLFLQLLDDWSILYRGEGYRFDVIEETVANPEKFMDIITSPVVPDDPRSSGLHGFVAFLAFSIDLQSLLLDAAAYPLLQSCIWHHYGYWFDNLSDELGDKVSLAVSHFLAWHPPDNLILEAGETSTDAQQKAITQIHDFVARTQRVLLQLFSSDFRQPALNALIAGKPAS